MKPMWFGDRLGVGDATMYWIGRRMPTDQFAVYAFDAPLSSATVRARVADRVALDGDLRVRLWDVPGDLDYPHWVPRDFGDDQVEVHGEDRFDAVVARLGVLVSGSVDVHRTPWRVHVFPAVGDLPGGSGVGGLVVLQVSHALRDGRGVSELARVLFEPIGRVGDVAVDRSIPGLAAIDAAPASVRAGVASARATALGAARWAGTYARKATSASAAESNRSRTSGAPTPPARSGFTPLSLNADPGRGRRLRIVATDHDRIRRFGPSVTVGALVVIGEALRPLLVDRGDPTDEVGAEVTIATTTGGSGASRNRYRNVGIDLYLDRGRTERAELIAAELAAVRSAVPTGGRTGDPGPEPPARQRHREVRDFPLHMRPERMTGNTVISSINRGPADLEIGGSRSIWAVGFPALSPSMALTHGVYGLGSSVTIGICAGDAEIDEPTIDRYAARMRSLLD